LICPSDPDVGGGSTEEALNIVQDRGNGLCPATCVGIITNSDQSYVYFGFVGDKVSDDDAFVNGSVLQLDPLDVNAQLAAGLAMIQTDPRWDNRNSDDDSDLIDRNLNLGNNPFSQIVLANAQNLGPSQTLGNGTSNTINRLREGIERFLITDINNPAGSALAQSDLAVMWDLISSAGVGGSATNLYNHIPGGSNVLYMDGHVEFQRFPGEFPATRTFAELVSFFG